MADKLKLPIVRKRVKALVDERPGYVYQPLDGYQCLYFDDDGSPSCLVGHALADELTAAGIGPGSEKNSTGIGILAKTGTVELSKAAAAWLHDLQSAQDTGSPWRQALHIANRRIGK